MEFIEARALKSSALSQMAVKPNCNDDVWGIHTLPPSDDNFPVEDLLNLDQLDDDDHHDDHDPQFDHERNSNFSSTTTFSGAADEFDSLSAAGQLAIPPDDFEDLEWLSQFVDDSPTELSLLCPVGSFTAVSRGKSIETVNRPVRMMRVPFLPSPVPRKARSYRPTRPSRRRPWYLSSSPTLSAAESSTTTSSNGSSVLPPLPVVVFGGKPSVFEADWFCSVEKPPPAKKQKKSTPEADLGRKCTHCQVNKTPQWRTGPQGPKTLCNACGVRYKSGRLFPEYRPACSPTFSKEAHSNSHRKVLEMRRKKETTTQGC